MAYAICGGEDAHGLLDATPVEALERLARDEDRAHGEAIDRVLKLQADKEKLRHALAALVLGIDAGGATLDDMADARAAIMQTGDAP